MSTSKGIRLFASVCMVWTLATQAPAAPAVPLSVSNADFQSPLLADGGINTVVVTGWSESGGTIGNFNPNAAFYTNPNITDSNGGVIGTMLGNNVLFFYTAAGQTAAQTLVDTGAAGVTYTLTVAVGARDGAGNTFAGYTIDLLGGGSALKSVSGTTPPAAGSFGDVALSFTPTAATGNLGVRLGMGSVPGGTFVDFDNVRLTATVASALTVAAYAYDSSGEGAAPTSWPDTGGTELINGTLPASTDYQDAQWVGFLDSAPDDLQPQPRIKFDLGAQRNLDLVQIVYLHNTAQAGGTITAPEEVRISASKDGSTWSPVRVYTPFDSSASTQIRTAHVALTGLVGRYVRLDFRNTSPWTFLAEVTFGGSTVANPATPLPVDIVNASFQLPAQATDGSINVGAVTGWSESGGTIGNFNPSTAFYTNTKITDSNGGVVGDMAGNTVLFFSTAGGSTVEQTLAGTAVGGLKYTLTAAVGYRDASAVTFGGYAVQLLANSTVVAATNSTTAPGTGIFLDVATTYTPTTADTGKTLALRLGMPVLGANHVDYDNVRLGAEVVNPIPILLYQYDGAGEGAQPSTSPSWPDTGGIELSDRQVPAAIFTEVGWVGFQDAGADDATEQPRVRFDLAMPFRLQVAQVVYLHSVSQAGGSITAPESVWVSVSTDGSTWTTPVQKTAFDSSSGDATRTANIDLTGLVGRYVRLDFRNTSQWTFLGEVTFGGTTYRGTVFTMH